MEQPKPKRKGGAVHLFRAPRSRIVWLTLILAALGLPGAQAVLAAQVRLTWLPNTEPTLAGYTIHYGSAHRSYTTTVDLRNREASCVIGGLEAGKSYHFAVSAYGIHGERSDYSNEVSCTIPETPSDTEVDTFSTIEDTPVFGMIRAGGSNEKTTRFRVTRQPSMGSVTLPDSGSGAFFYSPGADANGKDSFTVEAGTGSSGSKVRKISINIAPANDPPAALPDRATITRGVTLSLDVLANDRDPDRDPLTLSEVGAPDRGRAEIVANRVQYTPPADFTGMDSFTYRVSDGQGGTASSTVNVQVLARNKPPQAADSSITVRAGSSVAGQLKAWDPDGNPLSYSIVSPPAQGQVIFDESTGAFTFTAPRTFTGMDSLTFRASDGRAESNTASVWVNVSESADIVFAVNAGGPEYTDANGVTFEADTGFSGGWAASRSSDIESTEDDLLYQSERVGAFDYTIPLADGHYLVTLKFAEIHFEEDGRRVFDVLVEGREVVTHLDIHATAGKLAAYDYSVPVWIRDGALNLDFRAHANHAKLSGMVIEKWKSDLAWGINAGGTRHVDGSGIVYEEDMFYSSSSRAETSAAIAGTGDQKLYQSERYGDFTYDIPLPEGLYQVTLKFAENYFSEPGRRVFDVAAEGLEVCTDLDLLTRVGMREAFDYPILVTVEDGELNLQFTPKANWAKLGAMLIERLR